MAEGTVQNAVKAAIKVYLVLSERAMVAAHEAVEAWNDLVAEVQYERSCELMELQTVRTRSAGRRRSAGSAPRARAKGGRSAPKGSAADPAVEPGALVDAEPLELRAEDSATTQPARRRRRRSPTVRPEGD